MENTVMPLRSDMQELVQHGSSEFPIQYYVNRITSAESDNIPLHWHPRPEFFVVHRGAVRTRAGSAELTINSGEGLFINVNTLHSYACAGEDTCLCPDIVFSEELIAPLESAINHRYLAPVILNEKIPFIHLRPEIPWHKEILGTLDRAFSLLQRYGKAGIYGKPVTLDFNCGDLESPAFEMEVQRMISSVMQTLFIHRKECEVASVTKNEHALQIRMQKMLNFINENYSREITLNDIAGSASISKSEASRCFQSYLGTSPVSYLLGYRIQKAMKLLRTGEMTVEAISMECCFGSSAYFCKIFRARTGMTPKQYRSQWQENK
ncbi:MAG: AraC family transcriptional regulator [Oscillospiraceae bacterium]